MTEYRPFVIRRTAYGEFGGDVLREFDPLLPVPSLRYGAREVLPEEVEGTALLTRPYFYDGAIITVQIPMIIEWEQALVVRGGFGAPTTPQDGMPIWYTDERPTKADGVTEINLSQEVLDTPLSSPHWYYYSLFLWVGGQWVLAVQAEVLVPADHGWGELLFTSIPPFYQKTDNEQAADGRNGPLRLFANILGYDLDYTQCWADGVQNVYSMDFAPMKLLRYLGDNMGFPYEEVLGGNRTRSVLEQLDELNGLRGTRLGLQRLVTAASDFRCDIQQGSNDLLAVDDGDFHGGGGPATGLTLPDEERLAWGVGHWEPLTNTTYLTLLIDPIGGANASAAASTPAHLAKNTVAGPSSVLTPPGGRGAMVVNGPGPQTVIVCGHISADTPALQPGVITSGVPVVPGALYEVSVQTIRTGWGTGSQQPPEARVIVGMIWWDAAGAVVSTDTGPITPDNTDETTWGRTYLQAFAPSVANGDLTDALYATPIIWWKHASAWTGAWTDPDAMPTYGRYISMMNFGKVRIEGEDVAPVAPDIFLTLGVVDKLLAGPESYLGEP